MASPLDLLARAMVTGHLQAQSLSPPSHWVGLKHRSVVALYRQGTSTYFWVSLVSYPMVVTHTGATALGPALTDMRLQLFILKTIHQL